MSTGWQNLREVGICFSLPLFDTTGIELNWTEPYLTEPSQTKVNCWGLFSDVNATWTLVNNLFIVSLKEKKKKLGLKFAFIHTQASSSR